MIGHKDKSSGQARAERVTLAISVVLLAAIVGGLAWLEVRGGDSPAALRVTPHFSAVYHRDGHWYLPVSVKNIGDQPTDLVRVDVVRPITGQQPEIGELSFQFVAGGETVDGTAILDERPTPDTVEMDALSTTEP